MSEFERPAAIAFVVGSRRSAKEHDKRIRLRVDVPRYSASALQKNGKVKNAATQL